MDALPPVTFEQLQNRLLQLARLRIQNGEFTERALGRILGVSQPQIHNVLKGARRLQTHLADKLMNKLGISTIDLLADDELDQLLRLKIAQSERLAPEGEEDLGETLEFDLGVLLGHKMPPGRSLSRVRRFQRETG